MSLRKQLPIHTGRGGRGGVGDGGYLTMHKNQETSKKGYFKQALNIFKYDPNYMFTYVWETML